MKNNLMDILYNPGSINTCKDLGDTEGHYLSSTPDFAEADYALLQRLEGLIIADSETEISRRLVLFYNQLFLGASPMLLSTLLKEFNNFLHRTALSYSQGKSLFHQCLKIIIEFKNQVDKHSPSHTLIGKQEWVELERALFYLTQWEYKLGVKVEEMVLFEQ